MKDSLILVSYPSVLIRPDTLRARRSVQTGLPPPSPPWFFLSLLRLCPCALRCRSDALFPLSLLLLSFSAPSFSPFTSPFFFLRILLSLSSILPFYPLFPSSSLPYPCPFGIFLISPFGPSPILTSSLLPLFSYPPLSFLSYSPSLVLLHLPNPSSVLLLSPLSPCSLPFLPFPLSLSPSSPSLLPLSLSLRLSSLYHVHLFLPLFVILRDVFRGSPFARKGGGSDCDKGERYRDGGRKCKREGLGKRSEIERARGRKERDRVTK